jgi:hypothetical protein
MATARLQSSAPEAKCGGHDRFCMAEQLVSELDGEENVLLGGDMCWNDDVDLPFPLRSGWVDAWTQLKPRADLAESAMLILHSTVTCGPHGRSEHWHSPATHTTHHVRGPPSFLLTRTERNSAHFVRIDENFFKTFFPFFQKLFPKCCV